LDLFQVIYLIFFRYQTAMFVPVPLLWKLRFDTGGMHQTDQIDIQLCFE